MLSRFVLDLRLLSVNRSHDGSPSIRHVVEPGVERVPIPLSLLPPIVSHSWVLDAESLYGQSLACTGTTLESFTTLNPRQIEIFVYHIRYADPCPPW